MYLPLFEKLWITTTNINSVFLNPTFLKQEFRETNKIYVFLLV